MRTSLVEPSAECDAPVTLSRHMPETGLDNAEDAAAREID